jgi:hypothetical protein
MGRASRGGRPREVVGKRGWRRSHWGLDKNIVIRYQAKKTVRKPVIMDREGLFNKKKEKTKQFKSASNSESKP